MVTLSNPNLQPLLCKLLIGERRATIAPAARYCDSSGYSDQFILVSPPLYDHGREYLVIPSDQAFDHFNTGISINLMLLSFYKSGSCLMCDSHCKAGDMPAIDT